METNFKIGESVMTDHSNNIYKVKGINKKGEYLLEGTSGYWAEWQLKPAKEKPTKH